jgi:hypothetical protein
MFTCIGPKTYACVEQTQVAARALIKSSCFALDLLQCPTNGDYIRENRLIPLFANHHCTLGPKRLRMNETENGRQQMLISDDLVFL